ncbi:4'-phosphopantetheinyl transferase family protein [Cochlodiniinecator piscidefendens]|uniref:4'-phosphopantetheinyl transferase family protein n=1 Tax=Cochlodiniinecator piscidefendens TaxID=2715756 RepID=UPI0014072829|nr:4'-phosphopantetheinyl transferase superfamily protein [Cochlodiniinecator piscidefendens]
MNFAELKTLAKNMLPPEAEVVVVDPRLPMGDLYPDEAKSMQSARPQRLREFTAGRTTLRRAMAGLDLPPQAIPMGDDRAPIWPNGVTGSLSHCDSACIGVVAHQAEVETLAIDIEPASPLHQELWDTVFTKSEQEWLARQPVAERGIKAKEIFSAKECAYKAQYNKTKEIFDFQRFNVILLGRTFSAMFTEDTGEYRKGHEISGKIGQADGYILTTVAA